MQAAFLSPAPLSVWTLPRQVCVRMFCCGSGCYYGDTTARGLQPGLLPQHSLAIWSLGHWEIADNLGENGWKIAVFRPLPPAPSFLFSYFLFYFVPFNATKLLQKPRNNMRVWLDFSPPVCDVFCKQTCKLIQNLTSLRQNGERLTRGAGSRRQPG